MQCRLCLYGVLGEKKACRRTRRRINSQARHLELHAKCAGGRRPERKGLLPKRKSMRRCSCSWQSRLELARTVPKQTKRRRMHGEDGFSTVKKMQRGHMHRRHPRRRPGAKSHKRAREQKDEPMESSSCKSCALIEGSTLVRLGSHAAPLQVSPPVCICMMKIARQSAAGSL